MRLPEGSNRGALGRLSLIEEMISPDGRLLVISLPPESETVTNRSPLG